MTSHTKSQREVPQTGDHVPSPLEVLRGSVLFYERPLDPVGEDDWKMLDEAYERPTPETSDDL